MPCRKLPNYLRTYRKHSGFSQEEVAFLLGCNSRHQVSRFELSRRTPRIQTLIAYGVVFQISTGELFGGLYQEIEEGVCQRARSLAARIHAGKPDQTTTRKLAVLRAIMNAPAARVRL